MIGSASPLLDCHSSCQTRFLMLWLAPHLSSPLFAVSIATSRACSTYPLPLLSSPFKVQAGVSLQNFLPCPFVAPEGQACMIILYNSRLPLSRCLYKVATAVLLPLSPPLIFPTTMSLPGDQAHPAASLLCSVASDIVGSVSHPPRLGFHPSLSISCSYLLSGHVGLAPALPSGLYVFSFLSSYLPSRHVGLPPALPWLVRLLMPPFFPSRGSPSSFTLAFTSSYLTLLPPCPSCLNSPPAALFLLVTALRSS